MITLPPQWMHWTLPTLIFLGAILLLIVGLTVWDMKEPGYAREGLLPIETTRGDRVFMGILLTGSVFCLWLLTFSQTAVWTVLAAGVVVMASTIRWF